MFPRVKGAVIVKLILRIWENVMENPRKVHHWDDVVHNSAYFTQLLTSICNFAALLICGGVCDTPGAAQI